MIAFGRRSNTSRMAATIVSSATCAVPNDSTYRPTGFAYTLNVPVEALSAK